MNTSNEFLVLERRYERFENKLMGALSSKLNKLDEKFSELERAYPNFVDCKFDTPEIQIDKNLKKLSALKFQNTIRENPDTFDDIRAINHDEPSNEDERPGDDIDCVERLDAQEKKIVLDLPPVKEFFETIKNVQIPKGDMFDMFKKQIEKSKDDISSNLFVGSLPEDACKWLKDDYYSSQTNEKTISSVIEVEQAEKELNQWIVAGDFNNSMFPYSINSRAIAPLLRIPDNIFHIRETWLRCKKDCAAIMSSLMGYRSKCRKYEGDINILLRTQMVIYESAAANEKLMFQAQFAIENYRRSLLLISSKDQSEIERIEKFLKELSKRLCETKVKSKEKCDQYIIEKLIVEKCNKQKMEEDLARYKSMVTALNKDVIGNLELIRTFILSLLTCLRDDITRTKESMKRDLISRRYEGVKLLLEINERNISFSKIIRNSFTDSVGQLERFFAKEGIDFVKQQIEEAYSPNSVAMLFDTRMKALIAYIKSLNITKRSLFEKEEMIGSNEAKVVAQNLYKKIAVEISKLRRRFSDFEKEDFISLSPLKRRKYIEYLRKTALDNQLLNLESLRKEIQKLKSNHSIYIKIDKIWIELLMTLRVPYERMLSLEREIEDIIGHEIFFNRFTRNELNDINLPTDCLNSPKLTEAGHREFDKQKETNDKVLFYRRIIKNGLNKKTRNRKCDCINSGLNKIIWETDFESEKGINDLLADFKQNEISTKKESEVYENDGRRTSKAEILPGEVHQNEVVYWTDPFERCNENEEALRRICLSNTSSLRKFSGLSQLKLTVDTSFPTKVNEAYIKALEGEISDEFEMLKIPYKQILSGASLSMLLAELRTSESFERLELLTLEVSAYAKAYREIKEARLRAKIVSNGKRTPSLH